MKRHHQILAGVLAIQVVLGFVVFWPRPVPAAGDPLFPDLEVDGIVALTIADAEGNSVTLQKADATGSIESAQTWILPDADGYLAKMDRISPLLEKIVSLTTSRLVGRSAGSHRRLQVADDAFARRIDLETADGTGYTLYLGYSPVYGATLFRLDGQAETYLTDGLSSQEVVATYASWIDTTYFALDQDELAQVTLENANGTFTFVSQMAGDSDVPKWTLVGIGEDESLAVDNISALIERSTSVRMLEPLGTSEEPGYGLGDPAAVVTMEKKDGQVITLRVGAGDIPGDSGYVVKASESPLLRARGRVQRQAAGRERAR